MSFISAKQFLFLVIAVLAISSAMCQGDGTTGTSSASTNGDGTSTGGLETEVESTEETTFGRNKKPRAKVMGGTHAMGHGYIQSIGGNAVSTLRDGKHAATTLAESASAAIGGLGPNSIAKITAHTNGESVWGMSKEKGTNAHSYSMTHQTREHYGTSGTSKTTFGGHAIGDDGEESTEGAHGADVSLVSPHFSGGYSSVGAGYGKEYHAYAGQKHALRDMGYSLFYSIPVEAITNQYYQYHG